MKYEILTLDQKSIADFARARNDLLEKVKSEWILFLDTDEKLSPKLVEEIERLDPKDVNGFFIKRKIIFLGKCVGQDKVLRLARKGAGKWQRAVHETWVIKGKTKTLKNYIIHDTAKNLSSYIEKMNFYSTLHAKENVKEGKRSNIFKIIFYPKAKFIQNLFLGRGILFSMLQSLHSFLSWTKLWELQNKKH